MISQREKLIHCAWAIGVLALSLVASVTLQIGDDSSIANLISVATGLVSLVVGIIAIIYAFFTNGSLSDSGHRLESASKSIEYAAKQTADESEKIRIELAPLKRMAEQLADIHSVMPTAAQGSQPAQRSSTGPVAPTLEINQLVDYFLNSASWNGILSIYAALERHALGKAFQPYSWATHVGNIAPDYAIGYFVCTSCTGMLDYDREGFSQRGEFLLTEIHYPALREKVTACVQDNLTRLGLDPSISSLRADQKAKTDTYVNSQ